MLPGPRNALAASTVPVHPLPGAGWQAKLSSPCWDLPSDILDYFRYITLIFLALNLKRLWLKYLEFRGQIVGVGNFCGHMFGS